MIKNQTFQPLQDHFQVQLKIYKICINMFPTVNVFFYQEPKPTVNKQCDSICAKLFAYKLSNVLLSHCFGSLFNFVNICIMC